MKINIITEKETSGITKRLLCQPKSLPFSTEEGVISITLSNPSALYDLKEHLFQHIKELLTNEVLNEKMGHYGYTESFKETHIKPILINSISSLTDFHKLKNSFGEFFDTCLDESTDIEIDSFILFNVGNEKKFLEGILNAIEEAVFEEMLEMVIEESTNLEEIKSMPAPLENVSVEFDIDEDGVIILFPGNEEEGERVMPLGVPMERFSNIINTNSQRLEEVFTIAASFLLFIERRASMVKVQKEYFEHLYAYLFEKYEWKADVEMAE